ncbi:MAG: aminotransferase class I/II-fold pyridoxal phosphate-dependent enzyme [Vulcanococcus sp.]|jgi:aspartate/methionine/tyrosine aminotransferase|uniref:aminotransferase class I/II-fold pyridoxal phosphate-dependent enzyme n=1 Tax=Vulcanococcus sp. TaxID=2856995 RepID=UPI0025CD5059|nr:aminotransferase class I/II-fold pyridoxal phosphate-dependent enzyme [Vulcanococcus sp.]MBW0173498.1 aminotransferase class I/II-fold pyridoxal phosphate-dependent enzyme [Vulcanococcus sp.]MBW0179560.1 aminotransferase class I/II-fold pyridoxal phosphate-dependent enzyme [Vulcanococcus sp.]
MTQPAAARRLEQVQQPVIPVMGELTRQTPGTLSLGQGMVSWGPPEQVRQAVAAALQQGDPGLDRYGPVAGSEALREALGLWLQREQGLDLSASALLITAGSNMAFNAVVQVLCDPGDELILPVPYYFNHEMAIRLAGAMPVAVEAGVVPDPERLAAAITPRTRAIVTISPNNPSGAMFRREVLAAINRLCAERGLLHISDEAYALFSYGGEPVWSPGSGAGSGSHTITLGSLSKSHGMAGWRIGWAVVPQSLMDALAKVQDTILIHPPQLNQQAALGALAAGADWCRGQIQDLAARRQQVLDALSKPTAPWRLLAQPDGAFYALLQLESSLSSDQAMEQLIRQHRVALVSGSSFGLSGCCLRLSYGMLDAEELSEALERLVAGLWSLSRS